MMFSKTIRRDLLILTFVLLILALAFDISSFVFAAVGFITLIIINDIVSDEPAEQTS